MKENLELEGKVPASSSRLASQASPFTSSDLPLNSEGAIYHLGLKPGQIAPDILLVGDPGRAELIASKYLHDIEVEHEHRGLVTATGISSITAAPVSIISPLRTTVATSGIGTPSLEIVVNELVALNEIDFETRTRKPSFPRLHIVRIGTSGGLQASTELGTLIITSYAIGLDNTGLFYEAPYADKTCERLEQEIAQVIGGSMQKASRFAGKIQPYVSRSEPMLVDALVEAARVRGVKSKLGMTVSNSGFFAPQGREVTRVRSSIPELDRYLSEYDPQVDGQCIENMEMEASFLIYHMGALGYWAGAICAAIANRRQDTFLCEYHESIENAIEVALLALASLRARYPDALVSG